MDVRVRAHPKRLHAAIAAIAVGACLALAPHEPGLAAARTVTFRTDDGVTIAATWYEPSTRPAPAVVLIHMMKRSRRDWDTFASRLAAEGVGALAVDLRGHGDSSGGVASDDLGPMVGDVTAARRYLATRPDVQPGRIGFAGASLGANLAVLAAVDVPATSLALLSPSLDYRGLRIEGAVRKLGTRPVLLVASGEDAYAVRTVKDLQKAGGGTREVLMLAGAGHGTAMLGRDADLARALVDWFRRTL